MRGIAVIWTFNPERPFTLDINSSTVEAPEPENISSSNDGHLQLTCDPQDIGALLWLWVMASSIAGFVKSSKRTGLPSVAQCIPWDAEVFFSEKRKKTTRCSSIITPPPPASHQPTRTETGNRCSGAKPKGTQSTQSCWHGQSEFNSRTKDVWGWANDRRGSGTQLRSSEAITTAVPFVKPIVTYGIRLIMFPHCVY